MSTQLETELESDKKFFEQFQKEVQDAKNTEAKLCLQRRNAIYTFAVFFNSSDLDISQTELESLRLLDVCYRYDRKLVYLFEKNFNEITDRLTRLLLHEKGDKEKTELINQVIEMTIRFEAHTSFMKHRLVLEGNFVAKATAYMAKPSLQDKQDLELEFGAYLTAWDSEKNELLKFLQETEHAVKLNRELQEIITAARKHFQNYGKEVVAATAVGVGLVSAAGGTKLGLLMTAFAVTTILATYRMAVVARNSVLEDANKDILSRIREKYTLHKGSLMHLLSS